MKKIRILSLIMAAVFALSLFATVASAEDASSETAAETGESSNTPTPHNEAKAGDFAKTVLMPGDPLRAKLIAETMLEDVVLVNNVRGIQGYTGYYNGKRVSVMASGMGSPSMGIYSYELFNYYGVETIIRIGTVGAIDPDLNLFDIVIAEGACYETSYPDSFGLSGTFAPIADFGLMCKAAAVCEKEGFTYKVGNILTSEVFYRDEGLGSALEYQKMGVLGVEMETAALYTNAARAGKKALSILTVSDLLTRAEATTAEQRETAMTDMIRIALEIAEE